MIINTKHTEETKQKISESHKGKKLSNETKKKISEYRKTRINNKNPVWKGGVWKLNIPLYDTYAIQIEPIEECRKTTEGYLEVKCAYCGKWYVPKTDEVRGRIQGINGICRGEKRLYCSKDCKLNCPIYGKKPKQLMKIDEINTGHYIKPNYNRELQPELRKLVFERDNWTCIKCMTTTNLHCHHIEGIVQNPIESADMDICITLCKECHKEVHRQNGCNRNDMRCRK